MSDSSLASEPAVSPSARLFWIGVISGIPGTVCTVVGGVISWRAPEYHDFLRGAILGCTAGSILGNLWILADPARLSFLSQRKEKMLRWSYGVGSLLAAIAVVVQSWVIVREIHSVAPLRAITVAAIHDAEIVAGGAELPRRVNAPQALTELASCLQSAAFRLSAQSAPSDTASLTIRLQDDQSISLVTAKTPEGTDLVKGRPSGATDPIYCTVPGIHDWIARFAAAQTNTKGE